MALQTIHFRILPDGRVEERVEGVLGAGCAQLTERLEQRLGSVQRRLDTSEAFQRDTAPALQDLQQSHSG